MEPILKDLIQLLDGLKGINGELLELGKKKQKELINGSLEAIEALTRQEEALIMQAGRLEKERNLCAGGLILRYNLPENAGLTELITLGTPEEQRNMETLFHDLTQIIGELDKTNQENMNLIQQSLRYINFTVDVISQQTEKTTYAGDKSSKKISESRLLDRKV